MLAASVCVRIDDVSCFTNRNWTSSQSVRATLWKQYSYVAYGRQDGRILASQPVTPSVPTGFQIHNLFRLYNAAYGFANLSDSSPRTLDIMATIQYHAVEQITALLKGNVGIGGLAGDVDHFWSSFGVRSLLIQPLMDYVSDPSTDQLTEGASAKSYSRVVIPKSSVFGFLAIVLSILLWCGCCLLLSPRVQTPNASLYPEIDFGSKCVQTEVGESNYQHVSTIGEYLSPLSNATTKEVSRNLRGVSIYAGSISIDPLAPQHVILTTDRRGLHDLREDVRYG